MEQSPKDSSSIYDIISTSTDCCQICWSSSSLSLEILTACGHNFCPDCLISYYSSSLNSFEICPFRCPVCESDIHKTLSKVLPNDEYKRYKKLRKRQILLKDPKVIWCPIINCDGFGTKDQEPDVKCNNCDFLITNADQFSLDEAFKLSIVRCPVCLAWVERTVGCMILRCYCGTEFCCKCRSNELENHQCWRCFSNTDKGKTNFWIVFFCFFAYVFFPFLPAIFLFLYRKYWDKYYVRVLDEHPWAYAGFIILASPVILVFSLFYLPFIWGFYCVDAFFNSKSRKYSRWWNVLKMFVYLPSVFLLFIGWLLLLSLLLVFAPLFGLFLLSEELLSSLS